MANVGSLYRPLIRERKINLARDGMQKAINFYGSIAQAARALCLPRVEFQTAMLTGVIPLCWLEPLIKYLKDEIMPTDVGDLAIMGNNLSNYNGNKLRSVELANSKASYRVIKKIGSEKHFLIEKDLSVPDGYIKVSNINGRGCYLERELKFEFWNIPLLYKFQKNTLQPKQKTDEMR